MTERRKDPNDLTGRRGGYAELKNELHSFFRKIWVVVLTVGVTSTLGLVGYGFAIREVQHQRLEACEAQNMRHDNTEKMLRVASDADIERAKQNLPTSQGRVAVEEIENRRDVTLRLIDALQPSQNCDNVVEQGLEAYLP
jgi:hypothetical protein